jgi:hypothetical protein
MGNFLKIDAKIDFFYGAIFGAIPLLLGAGWFSLITIPACSILYAMGGDDDWRSAWRDVGVAAVNSVCLILATGNLLFLGAGLAVYGLLTVGLGLPDHPERPNADPGSLVGRFFWKLAKGKEWVANIYTHAAQYAAVWAVYFTASILRGVFYH